MTEARDCLQYDKVSYSLFKSHFEIDLRPLSEGREVEIDVRPLDLRGRSLPAWQSVDIIFLQHGKACTRRMHFMSEARAGQVRMPFRLLTESFFDGELACRDADGVQLNCHRSQKLDLRTVDAGLEDSA